MDEKRLEEGFLLFSMEEREVILDVLDTKETNVARVIQRLALARRRAVQRAESDRETDHARRVLVGAHVPRELAEKVRACASGRGVSMYRFLVDLLERACDNEGGSNPSGG